MLHNSAIYKVMIDTDTN